MPRGNRRRTMWIEDSLWSKIGKAANNQERTRSGWIRWAILNGLPSDLFNNRVPSRPDRESRRP